MNTKTMSLLQLTGSLILALLVALTMALVGEGRLGLSEPICAWKTWQLSQALPTFEPVQLDQQQMLVNPATGSQLCYQSVTSDQGRVYLVYQPATTESTQLFLLSDEAALEQIMTQEANLAG